MRTIMLIVLTMLLSGCSDKSIMRPPAELPEKPTSVAPMIEAARKPLVDANRKAVALAAAVPTPYTKRADAVVSEIVTARLKLGEAHTAAKAYDAQMDRLYGTMEALSARVARLQAHVDDIKTDKFDAGLWFCCIGGLIMAAGVAIFIWVSPKIGGMTATLGGALVAVGMALQFIAANMWLVWIGILLVVAALVYFAWRAGLADKITGWLKTVTGIIKEDAPELAVKVKAVGTPGMSKVIGKDNVVDETMTEEEWLYSAHTQAALDEAEADLAAGRGKTFDNADAALAYLHSLQGGEK